MWTILNRNTKKIIWVIIILIIPAFFLWGVSGVFMSKKNNPVVGKIGQRKILMSEYMKEYNSVIFMAQLIYREKFTQMRSMMDFNQDTWMRMLLLEEVKKDRIRVSEQELVDFIQSFEMFRTQGNFDFQKYNYTVSQGLKMTHQAFEDEMRNFLAMSKLKKVITQSAVVSESEVWEDYLRENKKRKIYYVTFAFDRYKDTEASMGEAELKTYFEKHQSEFEQPETVKVKYILQDFASMENEVAIDEEEIKGYYETHKNLYKKEEGYRDLAEVKDIIRRQLLYKKIQDVALDRMNDVYYALDEGRSFAEVVQEYNLAAKETDFFKKGDTVTQVGISKAFSEVPFDLNIGEFSEPIHTSQGICIVVPLEKKEAYIPVLAEVKSKIIDKIAAENAKDTAKRKAEEVRGQIVEKIEAEKFSFQEACKILKVEFRETDFISREDYIQDIYNFYAFKSAAFGLPINSVSKIIEDKDTFLFLLPAFEQYPQRADFESQRESLKPMFQRKKEQKLLSDWMHTLYIKYSVEDYTPLLRQAAVQ